MPINNFTPLRPHTSYYTDWPTEYYGDETFRIRQPTPFNAQAYYQSIQQAQAPMYNHNSPFVCHLGELFFIYGTLKQENRNNKLLIDNKRTLLQKDVVLDGFKLIELFNGIPAAVPKPGCCIVGEIWDMHRDNIELMKIIEEGLTKLPAKVSPLGYEIKCSLWVWSNPYDEKLSLPYTNWTKNVEKQSYEGRLTK